MSEQKNEYLGFLSKGSVLLRGCWDDELVEVGRIFGERRRGERKGEGGVVVSSSSSS